MRLRQERSESGTAAVPREVELRFSCSINQRAKVNSLGYSSDFGKTTVKVSVGGGHIYITLSLTRTNGGAILLSIPSCLDIAIPGFRSRVVNHFVSCNRKCATGINRPHGGELAWHEETCSGTGVKAIQTIEPKS